MCGIAGVLQKNGNRKELETKIRLINNAQFRRGPDDDGVVSITNNQTTVVLGNRRLSIQDLSTAGHQPMTRQMAKGKWQIAITFNGEVYNFLELRRALESKGYQFKTKTDTEVILSLYAEYREKFFAMLRGMFAFALYDEARECLFLVKDRYGIKPLYYYADGNKLVFASTVKGLSLSGLTPKEENPQAFIGFSLFGSVPVPLTTIKNVFAVPAGHYLVREANGSQKLVQYYEPLTFFKNQILGRKSDTITRDSIGYERGAIEKTRDLLEESVNLHLISDAPLGVFLSGGLDSSAIAALASNLSTSDVDRFDRLTTLSVVFDEKEFSEEKYSDLVAQKIKSDHRKVKITAQDFYNSFDEVFDAMDQPTIDGVNTFFISWAAKKAGLKAVLSGLGADEIFLGYPHFRKAELLRKIQNLPIPSVFWSFSSSVLRSVFGGRYSKLNYFKNNDILSFYLGIRGLFSPHETAKILGINLSEVESFIENLTTNYQLLTTNLHPVDLLSYLELKFYLQNQLLKDTDFMSMHYSVEVRVPFLDHKLVEYITSLPPEIKSGGRINKRLLVKSVSSLLPSEILHRPKMGFTFPFQKWLENSPLSVNGHKLSVAASRHWSRSWAKIVLEKFNQC